MNAKCKVLIPGRPEVILNQRTLRREMYALNEKRITRIISDTLSGIAWPAGNKVSLDWRVYWQSGERSRVEIRVSNRC